MKKIVCLVVGLSLSLMGMAQERKAGSSDFMKEEMRDFDKFVEDANKDFINFMRQPWKQFEAKKPEVKRVKPEPINPVVYDEKTAPKDQKPVCLNIEAILDLTTSESKQAPVIQLNDIDKITFDKPEVIVKKKNPTVIIIEEKVVEKPVVQSEKKPVIEVVETPKAQPKPIVPVVIPKIEPVTEPTQPIIVPANSPLYTESAGRGKVSYVGQIFYLNNALNRKCKLNNLTENSITDAYEALSSSNYKPLLADCSQIKKDLQLNDWGVFTLVRSVANAYCSTDNESIVMQQFLLNEMGYKARMARKADGSGMWLFVATDCVIYGHAYITLEGQSYYNVNGGNTISKFYMCQKDSPKARNSVGMHLTVAPRFPGAVVSSTHQAKKSAAKVTTEVPKALMDFYKNYPQCDYSVYFKSSVNKAMEDRILSSLAPLVQGKTEAEAANILIDFVQTGFEYKQDDQQFGYEKPFFVEELFYYPYSDCEDRAVLFSYLVRKLLGLDVVLLDYPEHIATAVRFKGNVGGDYLMVGGQQYTVCDPTYIGASIGMTMPRFKNVAAKVLKY